MMSVAEYALDVNKSIEDIFKLCKELNISVSNEEDLLDDEAITLLDNSLYTIDEIVDDEVMDDIARDMIETKNIKVDDSITKQKLKKKTDNTIVKKSNQKALKDKKKEMYKNKEKLISNKAINDSSVVLYHANISNLYMFYFQ